MRRLLPALLSATLLAGLLPLQVLAAAPGADPQSVTTNEDTPISITVTGTDDDSDPLTFSVIGDPAHGTLSGTEPNLTYTPNPNYNGPDSFTFTANDGTADSDPATVTITVTAVNDKPICAGPYASSGAEEAGQGGTLSCTDIDSSLLTYARIGDPSSGSATVAANGDWTYTPNPNYNGPDSFTFTANDGTVDSNTATVSITVSPVNDAPVAIAQSVTTSEDTAKAITLAGTRCRPRPADLRGRHAAGARHPERRHAARPGPIPRTPTTTAPTPSPSRPTTAPATRTRRR